MENDKNDERNNSSGKDEYSGRFSGRELNTSKGSNGSNGSNNRGSEKEEINLVMTKETLDEYFPGISEQEISGHMASEGMGKGTVIGGALGVLAGVITAAGSSIVVPGLGLIITGPIAAALAGVGAGGILGGIIGALIGWGIPKKRAKINKSGIKKENVVMGVYPRSDEDDEYLENKWPDSNYSNGHE